MAIGCPASKQDIYTPLFTHLQAAFISGYPPLNKHLFLPLYRLQVQGKIDSREHSPLFTHLQAAFTPHCCSMNKHLFLLIYSFLSFQHPPYASILPDNISNPITLYFFPKISKLQHTQNLKYHIFTYLSTAATQASISDSKGIPLQFYRI